MGGHRISPPFRPQRAAASGALSIEAAWRAGLKIPEEVMEILEAFDATGSLRAAAELVGCDHKTVGHWVRPRDAAGGALPISVRARPRVDAFAQKIEEWVERSRGKIRADVAHQKLLGLGYLGSERTARRVFGGRPGTYGTGILQLVDVRNWRDDADLAEVYEAWGGHAYGRGLGGVEARAAMRRQFARIDVAVKNVDTREHDLLDSSDYFAEHGGMIAYVRHLAGADPRAVIGDSSDPSRPAARTLAE